MIIKHFLATSLVDISLWRLPLLLQTLNMNGMKVENVDEAQAHKNMKSQIAASVDPKMVANRVPHNQDKSISTSENRNSDPRKHVREHLFSSQSYNKMEDETCNVNIYEQQAREFIYLYIKINIGGEVINRRHISRFACKKEKKRSKPTQTRIRSSVRLIQPSRMDVAATAVLLLSPPPSSITTGSCRLLHFPPSNNKVLSLFCLFD